MRISVWWSFYVDVADEAGVAAALKDVEALLGHKVQAEWMKTDEFVQNYADAEVRDSLFHVDAWSYLEVESIEQAAVHTLKQVQKLTTQLSTYQFSLVSQEDSFISIYWWYTKEDRLLPHFLSAGVQLSISTISTWDTKGCDEEEGQDKVYCLEYLERKRTRPVVRLSPPNRTKADYIAHYEVTVKASSQQKLLSYHWPKLQQKFSSHVTMINLKKRANNKGNFRFTIEQELNDVTEQQAIITCLSITGGTVKIELDEEDGLISFGTVDQSPELPPDWEGIFSFRLTKREETR